MNNSLKSFLEHHGILKNGKVRIIKGSRSVGTNDLSFTRIKVYFINFHVIIFNVRLKINNRQKHKSLPHRDSSHKAHPMKCCVFNFVTLFRKLEQI